MYQPQKKKYNDLKTLHKEMIASGQKVTTFNGAKIITKDAEYALYDGQILIKSLSV